MPNKTTVFFLVISACIIAGSVLYNKHLSRKILYQEMVLFSEDKEYFKQVDRYKPAVKDIIKKRYAYTDSFSFIIPLFDIFDTLNPCSNRLSEIEALVDTIAQNTALNKIKIKKYSSTLEVFDEAFNLILDNIDSMELAREYKSVPVLIVEEFSRTADYCYIKMFPMYSDQIPDSALVYKDKVLMDVDSIPFIYDGKTNDLLVRVTNGWTYVYH